MVGPLKKPGTAIAGSSSAVFVSHLRLEPELVRDLLQHQHTLVEMLRPSTKGGSDSISEEGRYW